MQRYEELVALRILDHERIKMRLQQQGHVILALDGLQPDVGHARALGGARLPLAKRSYWHVPC